MLKPTEELLQSLDFSDGVPEWTKREVVSLKEHLEDGVNQEQFAQKICEIIEFGIRNDSCVGDAIKAVDRLKKECGGGYAVDVLHSLMIGEQPSTLKSENIRFGRFVDSYLSSCSKESEAERLESLKYFQVGLHSVEKLPKINADVIADVYCSSERKRADTILTSIDKFLPLSKEGFSQENLLNLINKIYGGLEGTDKNKIDACMTELNYRLGTFRLTKERGFDIIRIVADKLAEQEVDKSVVADLANALILDFQPPFVSGEQRRLLTGSIRRLIYSSEAILKLSLASLPVAEQAESYLDYRNSEKQTIKIGKVEITKEDLSKIDKILKEKSYQFESIEEASFYMTDMIIEASKSGNITNFRNLINTLDRWIDSDSRMVLDLLFSVIKEERRHLDLLTNSSGSVEEYCIAVVNSALNCLNEKQIAFIQDTFHEDWKAFREYIENQQYSPSAVKYVKGMFDLLILGSRLPNKVDQIFDRLIEYAQELNEESEREDFSKFVYSFLEKASSPEKIRQCEESTCLSTAFQYDLMFNNPEKILDYAYQNHIADISSSFQYGITASLDKMEGGRVPINLATVAEERFGIKADSFVISELDASLEERLSMIEENVGKKTVYMSYYYQPNLEKGFTHATVVVDVVRDENDDVKGYLIFEGFGQESAGIYNYISKERLKATLYRTYTREWGNVSFLKAD